MALVEFRTYSGNLELHLLTKAFSQHGLVLRWHLLGSNAVIWKVQNMELSLADSRGTTCSTSQCSTTLPCASTRKISMPAQSLSLSLGHSWWQCKTTKSPSAMTRLKCTR